jgi:hypothetical protein
MPNDLRWIAPIPPEPDSAVLQVQGVTHEFHEEIRYRHAFECHCQWYDAAARKHRREAQKMQNDFNLLGWFCRGLRR